MSSGHLPFCTSASTSVPGAPASSLATASQELASKPGDEICAPDWVAVALLCTRQPAEPRSVMSLAPVAPAALAWLAVVTSGPTTWVVGAAAWLLASATPIVVSAATASRPVIASLRLFLNTVTAATVLRLQPADSQRGRRCRSASGKDF
ncbi:MAG TPA: hypothetical protein VGS19_03095 [Streptosporangiaceae bacterium]|nr:hypothetical protein [Streptosporangiaceae bacterium]